MECTLCKIQYVGKAWTLFSVRLTNDRNTRNSKGYANFAHSSKTMGMIS